MERNEDSISSFEKMNQLEERDFTVDLDSVLNAFHEEIRFFYEFCMKISFFF